MKFVLSLLFVFILGVYAQLPCDQVSDCVDCNLNMDPATNQTCNYCRRAQGGGFCTNVTSAGAADCTFAQDDQQDEFILTPQQCFGGCSQAVDCQSCSILSSGRSVCYFCHVGDPFGCQNLNGNIPGSCMVSTVNTCSLPCSDRLGSCNFCLNDGMCEYDLATQVCSDIGTGSGITDNMACPVTQTGAGSILQVSLPAIFSIIVVYFF